MAAYAWEKSYPKGVTWALDTPKDSLQDLFDAACTRFADRPALNFMGKRLTYAEIKDLSDRFAKGLQSLGVGPGVKVGLYLPNSPHYPIAFFGVLKAGGVVVNYSPLDAERELRHKIEDSETDFIITLDLNALYPNMAKFAGGTRLKKIIVGDLPHFLSFPKNILFPLLKKKDIASWPKDDRHISFRSLLDKGSDYQRHAIGASEEALAVLQYTGGTTGVPKGAMLTHANLSTAHKTYEKWTTGETPPIFVPGQERIMGVLPFFHIYALTVVMMVGLLGGAEIIMHPRFELDAVLKDLAKKKITIFPGVPTMYAAIINHPKIKDFDLTSIKYCNSGGAPLPLEVKEKFEALSGCKLVEGWGMTETAPAGTANPLDGTGRPGSAGLPMPGIIIEICNLEDPAKILPIGQTGEICIRGPNVTKGYWKKSQATADAFTNGRFHTGDMGYMDEAGYVFIVDRKKDMILSGGFNVYPRIIEEQIYLHPAVAEVTVIGVPDDYRGQSAKAFIRLKDGAAPFTLDDLRAFLKDKLGKHEMPAAVEFRDALPKTMIGKLSKKELVEEEMQKRQARKAG